MRIYNRFNALILRLKFKGFYSKMSLGNSCAVPTFGLNGSAGPDLETLKKRKELRESARISSDMEILREKVRLKKSLSSTGGDRDSHSKDGDINPNTNSTNPNSTSKDSSSTSKDSTISIPSKGFF